MPQYGPDGDPITISPAPRAENEVRLGADLEPIAPAEPIAQFGEGGVLPPSEDPASVPPPVTPEERLAEIERDLAALKAEHTAAVALVMAWENRAETTLIRSDFQRGQRDATLACVADLRGILHV